MSRTLIRLCRESSLSIFAVMWVLILAGAALDAHGLPSAVRALGAAMGTVVIFGYAFLIIFGFPAPYSSDTSRRVSLLAVAVLAALCIASSIDFGQRRSTAMPWLLQLLAAPLVILVFSPLFIATHVLGEARRALKTYKPLDSLGAWIALFYFAFGGVFFLHRTVATTVEALCADHHSGSGHAV
jgi:hypothetical protein